MPLENVEQIQKYIEKLELPDSEQLQELIVKPRGKSVLRNEDNEESAVVNAGSLSSFTQNLTGQQKFDVQNSTLLAQLAATKKFDRYKQTEEWYKFYIKVLENIGWIMPSFAFDTYTSGSQTINIDKAVLDILSVIVGPSGLDLISRTMGALEALDEDSRPMQIWNANSNSGNDGVFQIYPVDVVNGDLVMILAGMGFSADKHVSNFLWFSWETTSINLKRYADKCILNEQVYAQVREAVVEKLGDNALDVVAGIEI